MNYGGISYGGIILYAPPLTSKEAKGMNHLSWYNYHK